MIFGPKRYNYQGTTIVLLGGNRQKQTNKQKTKKKRRMPKITFKTIEMEKLYVTIQYVLVQSGCHPKNPVDWVTLTFIFNSS